MNHHEENRDAGKWKLQVMERMRGFNLLKTLKAVSRSTLDKNEKSTLKEIISHWSRNRPVPFASVKTLSVLTGLSTATVKRAIASLEAVGVLRVCRRKNRSNWYDLSAVYAETKALEDGYFAKRSRERIANRKGYAEGFEGDNGGTHGGQPREAPGNPRKSSRAPSEGVSQDQDGASNDEGGFRVSPGWAQGEPYDPPCRAQGEPRIDPSSLIEQRKRSHFSGEPANGGNLQSSSKKKESSEKEKAIPRDSATIEIENAYLDQYKRWTGKHYYRDKPDAKSRAAFKALHQAYGVADAKQIIVAAFCSEWNRKNRSLPWEILANAKRLLMEDDVADIDADAIQFVLRASTDKEMRLQAQTSGADLDVIEKTKAGTHSINPAWAFDHGFNPENSSWLRSEHAQNQWAAVQAAEHNNITPRYRYMVANLSKKQICRMLWMAVITPDQEGFANFALWNTKATRAEAMGWVTEWQAERDQQKSA